MTRRSRDDTPGAANGGLRPVWPERNPLLIFPNGKRLPVVSERTALDKEVAAYRERIAKGTAIWPPPILELEGAIDGSATGRMVDVAPRLFDWRDPEAFARLDAVRRIEREQQTFLETRGIASATAAEMARQAVNQLYVQAMWMHHGRRVYRLDADLVELLLRTRLPRLPAATLRFPLPGFLIALPEGRFSFAVASEPTPQPVDSIMIAVSRVDADVDQLREITLLVTCRSPRGPADDNVVWHGIAPDAGVRLDEIEAITTPGPTKELLDRAIHLSLGLALYLQSEHPALEPVPPPAKVNVDAIHNTSKRRKAERRSERASKLGFVWVGRHEGVGVKDLDQSTGSATTATLLDHQVWVSGHWKEQRYGPRGSLRRPQWIRPYLRGPDLADAMRISAKRVQAARRSK